MDFPNFSHENHEIFPIHRATPMAMETSQYRRPKRTTWWQSWSVASRRHYARQGDATVAPRRSPKRGGDFVTTEKGGSSSLYISDWDGLLYIHVSIYIYIYIHIIYIYIYTYLDPQKPSFFWVKNKKTSISRNRCRFLFGHNQVSTYTSIACEQCILNPCMST